MSWRQQFAKPTGALGSLFGHVMALTNKERGQWVFTLLELQPADRVLEIGFGPGTEVAAASQVVAFVAGVDHSDVMVRQASKRNSRGIREGRVELRLGAATQLPYPDATFDKVVAINSAQFWKDGPKAMQELHRVLKPRGLAALAVQPRQKGATEDHAFQAGKALGDSLRKAGFVEVWQESKPMKPVSTVCVLGRR